MKEKTVEFPSYSIEYLDDEIGGDDPILDPMIFDISLQQSSNDESEPELKNHLPTWAQNTLSSAGDNIGNPDDQRRTRSDFQSAGIALSCSDNLLSKTCCFLISLYPKSYYHSRNDPIWQVAMDEEMNSLQKNTTWAASFSSSGEEIGSVQVGVSE